MVYSLGISLFLIILSKLHAMPTDREPVREVNIGDVSIDTLNNLNFNLNLGNSQENSDKMVTRNNKSLSSNHEDTKLVADQTMQLLLQFMASTNTKLDHLMEHENKTQEMITDYGHISREIMERLHLVLERLNQSRLEEKTLDAISSVKAVIENSDRRDNSSSDLLTLEKFNLTMTYLLERIEKETSTDEFIHLAQQIVQLHRHLNASINSQLDRILELENDVTSSSQNHTGKVTEVLSLVVQRLNQSRQEHNILEAIDRMKVLIETLLIVGNKTDSSDQTLLKICNATKWQQNTENGGQTDGGERETPTDCHEVFTRGHLKTGVYFIKPRNATSKRPVRCEMSGTKWTVLMRRYNGAVDFNRTWRDYKHGFGYPAGEYWAGNELMHLLTNQGRYKLRIDLQKWGTGDTYNAEYTHFRVGPEADNYRLHIGGESGTAPRGYMSYHNNRPFSTKDHRNNSAPLTYSGGWWFGSYNHYLNGPYNNKCHGQCSYWHGVGALQAMSMKVARF